MERQQPLISSPLDAFGKVRSFLFDVDGVLTDGMVLVTDEGGLLRRMSTRDGYAMKLCIKLGFPIAIITGGTSPGVERRLRLLGVETIFSGISDKLSAFGTYLAESGIDPSTILYMGDDMPDWEVMQRVGFAACPMDADQAIQSISHYVSPYRGGEGCVRDVIEKTLRIQGEWPWP